MECKDKKKKKKNSPNCIKIILIIQIERNSILIKLLEERARAWQDDCHKSCAKGSPSSREWINPTIDSARFHSTTAPSLSPSSEWNGQPRDEIRLLSSRYIYSRNWFVKFWKGNETIKIEIYGDSTGYQGEGRGGDRERDLRDSDDTVREQTRKRRGTLFPHVRETRGGGRGGGSSSISVDRLVGSITRRPLPIVR